jgi:serine protease AprX
MAEERLYLKVVMPRQGIEKKKPTGGSKPKPFKRVTPLLRARLISGIEPAEKLLSTDPLAAPIVPLRIILETKALAKSHRKDALFNEHTCPIMGAGRPGELFAKGTIQGLKSLRSRLAHGESPQVIKEISAIKELRPVTPKDRLGSLEADTLFAKAHMVRDQHFVKVKLFTTGSEREQNDLRTAFEAQLQRRPISALRNPQYRGQDIYIVGCRSSEDVQTISNLVMVRSVGIIPMFRPLRGQRLNSRTMPEDLREIYADPSSFPIVAVVDSGVSSKIAPLESWIYDRERFVASDEENTYHGTFVAGLLVWGHMLNSTASEIGTHPCRILDIHVLPNADPTHGPVGVISEAELLQDLEQSLIRHSNEVRVWNLSLGSDEVCTLNEFSDFAIQLDNLQEKFGVTFVIAAGNYEHIPLLSYPRKDLDAERGRITSPADSVLGVTVASISQLDHPSSGGKRGEPSCFSRNGPGPNYIIKPDLAHFGGAIATDAKYPLGVTSLNDGPLIAEDIGTSFATPLVSRQLAYVHHRITPTPSSTLARAILTHNARDVRTGGRVADQDDHYLGFGTPLNIDRALECDPWTMTMVFEEVLRPGYYLEWDSFPYPESLTKNGKFRGEIWMTLAYPPLRNPNWGSEYCETHVSAHFGIYRDVEKKGEVFSGQVPPEHANPGQLYESFQVSNLRKWAPVRTYHRELPKGVVGKRWRLVLELLCRHGVEQFDAVAQPFALLLTISDPEKEAPVYDEMSRHLRTRLQTQNLTLRSTVRARA